MTKEAGQSRMKKKINVLCAVRDVRLLDSLIAEIDDEEFLSIAVAESGDAAYAVVIRSEPDILVADAVLPGMDGLGLVDRLRSRLGDRMPRVIGGASHAFARQGFLSRGAQEVIGVPWSMAELREAILRQVASLHTEIDWAYAQGAFLRSKALLAQLGMKQSLRGFTYLAWAAALAHCNEARLYGVGERLYKPIAARMDTTPQSVERLIRHAVESTMDTVGAQAVYDFFGNTIDPTRGKPTNAQILCALVQRMRIG